VRRVPYGPVRDGWQLTNYSLGLTYNDTELPDGTMESYWQEGPYYDFTAAEIEELETATATLHAMCLEAGDWMVRQCPRHTVPGGRTATSRRCARRRPASSPRSAFPSSPTSRSSVPGSTATPRPGRTTTRTRTAAADADAGLLAERATAASTSGTRRRQHAEAARVQRADADLAGGGAVIQWHWVDQTNLTQHPWRQWNSIHDRLVGWEAADGEPANPGAWRRNIDKLREARPWLPEKPKIFFAYETSETTGEDRMNVAYLMATAEEAGYPVELIAMSQIGWDVAGDRVVFVPEPGKEAPGAADRHHLHAVPLGVVLARGGRQGLLPQHGRPGEARHGLDRAAVQGGPAGQQGPAPGAVEALRRRPERSRYLLPSYFAGSSGAASLTSYAKKPVWGREGGSVTLVRDGKTITEKPVRVRRRRALRGPAVVRTPLLRRPGGHGPPGAGVLADRRRAGRHGHPRGPGRRGPGDEEPLLLRPHLVA
jgi:hypothetical protein